MKKVISILLAAVLMLCACITSSANTSTGNTYHIENVTVIFEKDSAFTVEEQQHIANMLANPEYGISTTGFICTLFGHKNTSEPVATITHCVNPYDPRCMEEFFTITTCSRCGETSVERLSYSYISCCPED